MPIERTQEHDAELFDKYLVWTSADRAAKVIIKGIRKNKARILVGPDAYFYNTITRLVPTTRQRVVSHT